MEAIVFLVIVFIVWAFISNSISETKIKEANLINKHINEGKLVRLSNGEIKSPDSITESEKSMLPDYKYLVENGSKYGYKTNLYNYLPNSLSGTTKIIDYMSIEELKEAAEIVRRRKMEDENLRRKVEIENQIKEQEQRILELELQEKERVRIDRSRKWEHLSTKIIFEIHESNPESKKRGIYVIRCLSDNRLYIGSSVNMLTRKSQHLSGLRNKKHHSFLLQEAFNELGEHNFKFYALQLIDRNNLFLLNPDRTDEEIEKALKRETKSVEQSYLNNYTPTFNIEDDTRGKRHWEGKSKYRSYYRY